MRKVAVSAAVSAALYSFSMGAHAQASPEAPAPAPAESQNLGSAGSAVEEVVVTGFRQSLAEGIELKREAVGVRDSIVAEDIGKFPEQNVAESLQRIPGVFLSRDGASNEGQRISIRGLGSQYSVTTINGAPVRTTSSGNVGSSTRDFNFDVFPSELFGRVDIYKSPQASLEEGGIAGNIDLQTPRPFDSSDRVIRYGGSYNYNDQSEEGTPRGSFLVSDTWGNFGALLGVAYAENINERSGFQSTGGYNSSALGSLPYTGPQPSNTTGPFSYRLNFDDPRANLGGLTREQVENAYLPRFWRVYTSNNERERLGTVASLQFKNDRLDVSLDGIFSNLEDSADEFTFGVPVRNSRTDPGSTDRAGTGTNSGLVPVNVGIDQYNNLYGTFANASYLGESFFRDSETKFQYGILRGAYDLTDTLKVSAQLNSSESDARYTENRVVYNIFGVQSTFDPTGDVSYPSITTPVDVTNPGNYTAPDLGFGANREIDRQATGRMQLDWDAGEWGGVDWSALVGLSRVSTTKRVERRADDNAARARTLPGGGTLRTIDVFSYMDPFIQYGTLENGGNPNYPSQFATFPRAFVMDVLDAKGWNAIAPVQLNQAFKAEEVVSSAFFEVNGATDIAGHELRGNVGVRYADTDVTINNYFSIGAGQFAPREVEGGYDNWLPSLSFAFDVTPDLVARASAGKTITRAALSNIASGTLVPNRFNAEITVGNPNLEPQVSTQFDLGLEWYFAPGGLLSGGVFKKKLEGTATAVIDNVTLGSTGLPDSAFDDRSLGYPGQDIPDDLQLRRTSYINQGTVELEGLELAYQQTFNFLPAPFDGFGTILSYTKIDTQGNPFVTTEGRTISVAVVPEESYSLTGYYEKGPFAVRASYNYRGESGLLNNTTNTGNDQLPQQSELGFLDASISYRYSDALEFRLDGLNLTNENTYLFYEDPDGASGNGRSRRDNSFFNGRTLSLGIRGGF